MPVQMTGGDKYYSGRNYIHSQSRYFMFESLTTLNDIQILSNDSIKQHKCRDTKTKMRNFN